jgi:hypothetical protein
MTRILTGRTELYIDSDVIAQQTSSLRIYNKLEARL